MSELEQLSALVLILVQSAFNEDFDGQLFWRNNFKGKLQKFDHVRFSWTFSEDQIQHMSMRMEILDPNVEMDHFELTIWKIFTKGICTPRKIVQVFYNLAQCRCNSLDFDIEILEFLDLQTHLEVSEWLISENIMDYLK